MTTMIIGELDYSDVFDLSYDVTNATNNTNSIVEDNSISYLETANFVWIVFLVFIPILLSNMLVSET